MALGRGRIRRIIELILDPNAARRAERDMQSALRRGTDPRTPDRQLGVIERGLNRLRLSAIAVGAALIGGIVVGLRKVVGESSEAQAVQAQLDAAIRSTGGAAGRTTEQLNEQAEALQKVTTFSDDAIGSAQGLLLTFTQIRGDTFDRATAAVLDMSTALGKDLRTSALQLGKALNDPVRGVTALSRAGVQLTQFQKDLIKELVETNRVAEAQGIILAEVERQMGGSARAARNTLGGALQALRNQWDDLFEVSGDATRGLVGFINELARVLPKLRTAADFVFQGINNLWFNVRVLTAGMYQLMGDVASHIPGIDRWAEAWTKAGEALERSTMMSAGSGQFARMGAHGRPMQQLAGDTEEVVEQTQNLITETDKLTDAEERRLKVLRDLNFEEGLSSGAGGYKTPPPDQPMSGATGEAPDMPSVQDLTAGMATAGTVGEEVAAGLQSVWADLFGDMKDGTDQIGFAWLALADIMTGSFGDALSRIAGMKATEMLAHAIEEAARGIAALATGNIPAAGAHAKAAAQFGAAAAAWKMVQSATGGGGGGGAAGQGITDAGGGIRSTAGSAELMAPQIHLYVDGFDPDNPRHVELLQRGIVNARQQWGDTQKPTLRRYASSR